MPLLYKKDNEYFMKLSKKKDEFPDQALGFSWI